MTKIVKKRLRQAAGVVVQKLAPENDRAALIRLFEQSDGENWKIRKNWLDGSMKLSSWHGISATERTVRRPAWHCQLCHGFISTSKNNDEAVTELNLADNNIRLLGAAIGFLCSLTKVDVSSNRELSGECALAYIHDSVICIIHATLDVIFSAIPDEISKLQKLENLNLRGTAITGE